MTIYLFFLFIFLIDYFLLLFIIIIIFICLLFLLYFENKEIFCSSGWLQICNTFCNLIYCSFVGFCVLILPLVLDEFKQILVPG